MTVGQRPGFAVQALELLGRRLPPSDAAERQTADRRETDPTRRVAEAGSNGSAPISPMRQIMTPGNIVCDDDVVT